MQDQKKPRFHLKYRRIIPILLVITIILTAASAAIFTLTDNFGPTSGDVSSMVSTPSQQPSVVEKSPIKSFKSISVVPGVDFLTDESEASAQNEIMLLIDNIFEDGFDSIELMLNYKDGLLFETQFFTSPDGELLKFFYNYAKQRRLTVITAIDLYALTEKGLLYEPDIEKICAVLSSDNIKDYSDMLIFKNLYASMNEFEEGVSDSVYSTELSEVVKAFYMSVVKADPTLYTGIEIDKSSLPENALFEVKKWIDASFIDFVTLVNPYSTEAKDMSFEKYLNQNKQELSDCDMFIKLAYYNVGSKKEGWKKTDQIIKQLNILKENEIKGFIIDGYSNFSRDITESRNAVKKYLADLLTQDYVVTELNITSPAQKEFKTFDKTVLLSGVSDPEFSLTLNDQPLERNELGYFSSDLTLNPGLNTFELNHKGVTETYKITYQKTVIKGIFPTEKLNVPSGSTLLIKCVALKGSNVTASVKDITVTLAEEPLLSNGQIDLEYSNYSGRITLPTAYDQNLALGKIKFKAVSPLFGTETESGSNINILKEDPPADNTSSDSTTTSSQNSNSSTQTSTSQNSSTESSSNSYPETSSNNSSADNSSSNGSSSTSSTSSAPTGGDPWVKPQNGLYQDIKPGTIATVINWQAETFNATDDSDYSRPTNNYLPEGTVDYCSSEKIYSEGGMMKVLRYGKMAYIKSSKGVETLSITTGTLPDHNTLNVASVKNTGRHTLITLDVLWKAPFLFELLPQKYTNEGTGSSRDYTISAATYEYVDITFCYTTLVQGEVVIPESNPIFSHAGWIENESDYTLRLYLKTKGKFYGWSAYYNDADQLVFSFLNPAEISAADNDYGFRLDGIIVAIDVGHGGNDVGALGSNKNYSESVLNLTLAKMLKAELESLGAAVVMTRYDNNTNPTSDQRMKLINDTNPDYCIAIHRNAASGSSPRGFASYHFNAFTSDPAKILYKATAAKNLYEEVNGTYWYGTKWHMFYSSRQTNCPVVLTENGFITNPTDFANMIRDDFNLKCAKALTEGIVNYFVSIQ